MELIDVTHVLITKHLYTKIFDFVWISKINWEIIRTTETNVSNPQKNNFFSH